jgi:hypothetical protein
MGKATGSAIEKAPTTALAYRHLLLQQLVKHYRDKVGVVFQQNKIWATAPEWNVSPRYVSLGIRLHDSRNLQQAMRLTREIGHAAGIGDGSTEPPIDAVLLGGLLVYQFVLPEFVQVRNKQVRLWTDVDLDHPNILTGVGLGAYNTPINFEFSDEAPHALVCGVSGSGKTELLKTIVHQLLVTNPPASLGVGIADPKGDFACLDNQEHLLFQPAHEFSDINRLFELFHNEYLRRQEHNVRNGRRWVLMVDEADQEAVLRNPLNNEFVNDIVLRGRSLKMNVIIGTHIPDVGSLGNIGRGLTNRWLGLTSSAKESGQVQGGLALHKLGGRGDFYAVVGNMKQRIQAALTLPKHWENLNYTNTIDSVKVADIEIPANHATIDDISKPAHRPKLEPDPYCVAFYLYHGTDRVTQVVARERLGLTRTGHELNRNFAKRVARGISILSKKGK